MTSQKRDSHNESDQSEDGSPHWSALEERGRESESYNTRLVETCKRRELSTRVRLRSRRDSQREQMDSTDKKELCLSREILKQCSKRNKDIRYKFKRTEQWNSANIISNNVTM